MKRLFLIALLVAFYANVFCIDNVPTKEQISQFSKTKTMVVLEDNLMSEYNLIMKKVMPEEWTMTPYDFITWKEFEKKRLDPNLSFLTLNQVQYDKDKSKAKYNFICLTLGGKALTLNAMPDLCSVPLSYYGVSDEDYSYKLGIFLRFIQNHVKMLIEKPELASENILKLYNKNISQLQGKTLYLVPEEMAKDINTSAKIKNVYSGPFKLVSKEEIQQAISDKKDVVFLHKVGPQDTKFYGRCYKIFIGAADAKFYYFDWHKVDDATPDALLAKDLKKVAK
jgi:hypothetical protein